MPDILRWPVRMDCNGVDLVHPVDRMPPGNFPYLFNVRVVQEGRLDSRPGYSAINPALSTKALHSIRRLNDPGLLYAPTGYAYVISNGTELWFGQEGAPAQIDTGFSGKPLSLLTFRPDNSPTAWMYVYDANKQVKVRPDGVIRSIGESPPAVPPGAEYGVPASVVITEGTDATGWLAWGDAASPTSTDRTAGDAAAKITAIVYDVGTSGWCILNPLIAQDYWVGERMRLTLNAGGGNAEIVTIREVHPAFPTTTLSGIRYDSGTTGPCTLTITGNPPNVKRNSMLSLTGENVRVLSVSLSADGISYSVRCSTVYTHAAGENVTGNISWYVYTALTHAPNESISINYISVTQTGATKTLTGNLVVGLSLDASRAAGRPISIADDYIHVSVFVEKPSTVLSLDIMLDIDSGTATFGLAGNAFTRNYLTWTVPASQLNTGPSSWTELVLPLSDAVRTGFDQTATLATSRGFQVRLKSTLATIWGIDDAYIFGTYGPFVPPNSPVGLLYQSRNRDATTGAASIPSPATRYELFPLREAVIVTPQASSAAGVDSLDIYRQGNGLTQFTYIGTVANNITTPNSFTDSQPDSVVAGNPQTDLSLLQPWPILGLPWAGVVSVVGTSVTWISGTQFDLNLVSGTIITINGVAYQTLGQPHSSTFLEISQSAGVQSNVSFEVSSPILAGQPLPYAFGPLEGPFAPVIFALGDPLNPGTLYFANAANADGASDLNTLEICPPGEPLVGGEVWNGIAFVGSNDNIYVVRYSYLATIGQSSNLSYQFSRIPSASGMWSRYAVCRGPDGVYYVGRDGVYRATEQGAQNISDALLYPLFPHDGQTPSVEHDIYPVDMSAAMRLSCCDQDIFFDYVDTAGNPVALRYEIPKKRWFPHSYADGISTHYLVERLVSTPTDQQILLLSKTLGLIYLSGGDTDNGLTINSIAQTPSFDSGDERAQKLYVDFMTDADNTGTLQVALFYDSNTSAGPVLSMSPAGPRNQFLENVSAQGALVLHRNVSAKYAWTGGLSGPRVYAFEPSGYMQPYVSLRIVTQRIPLSAAGWKHHRRLYAGLISTGPVQFTIETQDGRIYGPYTIPSTAGVYRIIEMMLDQGIKDLAFSYSLDGGSTPFALFPDSFTVETKLWTEPDYLQLAVFRA